MAAGPGNGCQPRARADAAIRSVKPLPRKALAPQPAGSNRFVAIHPLTEPQQRVTAAINTKLGRFAALLLHGVTGSGKTEIYLNVIAQLVERAVSNGPSRGAVVGSFMAASNRT